MVTEITSSSINMKYSCEKCDFVCSKKGDWSRHIGTKKHKKCHNVTENEPFLHQKTSNYICSNCEKSYITRNGLWYHKKKCANTIITPQNENSVVADASNNEFLTNLVLELVKSNTKLQEQMLEICKNNQPSSIITNNSHNKTFNLHFFLNEQCKNAMNLNEFVGSFELELEDLLMIGEQGYVEGITRIILVKLKALDIYKRPIHCSDLRRDSLFIRTDDVWCKEEPGNEKMAIAIKDIGKQNFLLLNEYREMHPDCLNHDSEFNDPYVKLIMQAAGGCVKENIDKIIKKIAKEVVIDKSL